MAPTLPRSFERTMKARWKRRPALELAAGGEAHRSFTILSFTAGRLMELTMRLLIVEDEPRMAGLRRRGLEREGFAVDAVDEGEEALWKAEAVSYDAIVLDLMLPGIDGLEVCARLRSAGVWSRILMLTAGDGVGDRVAGRDRGADDYLTKPFSYAELLARLRALIRRGQAERPTVLEVGDLKLDPATRQVWGGATGVQPS